MGKIVKYCSSCDEGFAERFGFCPDCGAQLQAFEMNPVEGVHAVDDAAAEPTVTQETMEATAFEPVPLVEEPIEEAPAIFVADEEVEIDHVDEAETAAEEVYEPAADVPFYQTEPVYADEPRTFQNTAKLEDDGGYYVTVIQETNGKQRNVLLLGATILMLTLTVGATVVSLFQKDLGIGAIGDERSLATLIDAVPMDVEEEEEQKKDDDKGGGGGGGGREEEQETSKGQLASQSEKPIISPTKTIVQKDFELQQPIATTQGNRIMPRTDERYGDPNSKFLGLSDGTGSGGGQGSGVGTGQGSGRGTGMGSGTGSGSGSGTGDGNGDGTGPGGGGVPPPPTKRPAVTTPVKITYQPRAVYTNEARTNNIQGAVRLKITLLASGQVGSITPVTRLPNGLTEQAIAAARQIKFTPKMVNGVPTSVIITRDYTFSIY